MSLSTDFQPVPTRAALALQAKQKPAHEFKALVFDAPKNSANNDGAVDTRKQTNKQDNTKSQQASVENEFDIKKARHEVINFAIANQRQIKNQRKMEMFQLIKMGAKPPKGKYKNYKELLDERKRLKQIREERKKFHQLGKNQTGAASVKCRSKTKLEKQQKKRAPVSQIDQHYGVAKPKFKKRK